MPNQPTTKLLTATQERDLALRVRAGDKAAREELITRNLRLAAKIARRYHSASMSEEDMEQEAVIGLIKAVDNFDPDRGLRFSTFAYPLVQHAIIAALRRSGRSVPTISLSSHIDTGDEDDLTLADTIADPTMNTEEAAIASIFAGEMRDLIESCLTPRELTIIQLYFGLSGEEPMTCEQIAPLFHLQRSRVQQIRAAALGKIKAAYLNQERRIPGFRQLLLDLEAAA